MARSPSKTIESSTAKHTPEMDLPASMWTVGCHSCHRLHEEVRALNKEIARLKELMKRGPIATVFDDVTGKATLLYELPK